MTFPKNIGELPEELTMRVLRMVGEDPLFELAAIVKGTDATPEQIATHAVRLVFESGWRGRMSVQTRDQVKCEVENHFRPPEGPAVDPIAESAQRGYDERDPFARELALREPSAVTVLRGAGRGVVVTRHGNGDDAS